MISKGTATISAMDLRREPGRFLDRVFYRGERFIVERAGEPKAVIVPVREYEQMEQGKQRAREQLTELTEQARTRLAQSGISEEELQTEIDAAITEVRAEKRDAKTSFS